MIIVGKVATSNLFTKIIPSKEKENGLEKGGEGLVTSFPPGH